MGAGIVCLGRVAVIVGACHGLVYGGGGPVCGKGQGGDAQRRCLRRCQEAAGLCDDRCAPRQAIEDALMRAIAEAGAAVDQHTGAAHQVGGVFKSDGTAIFHRAGQGGAQRRVDDAAIDDFALFQAVQQGNPAGADQMAFQIIGRGQPVLGGLAGQGGLAQGIQGGIGLPRRLHCLGQRLAQAPIAAAMAG